MPQSDMATYYARRASEYERIYNKPERQDDLRKLRAMVSAPFAGLDVLEIACGTGYWTQFIAESAANVTSVDCNPEVLQIARQKDYGDCRVSFSQCDAYTLAGIGGQYSAGFCGFWLSHVPAERLLEFLSVFHSKLQQHAVVAMIDNMYVEGGSTPIARTDASGNTYQLRTLSDGSKHEVLKNFPREAELRDTLSGFAASVEYVQLPYYWFLKYNVDKTAEQSTGADA